jgi:uncharacterized phage protein (TIGR01671 family)
MIRDIKFRAWDRQYGEMADVVEIVFDQHGGLDVRTSRRMGINAWALGRDSLMQFIGVKDKNGKEIYEGDIIKDDDTMETVVVAFEIDLWTEDGFATGYHFHTMASNYRVIGNIHENADLLTE